jgi:cytochrome P450
MPVTGDFIDLSDHDQFVEAVPHEAFAVLRRDDPVHWNPEPDGGRGFWAVTRYEDIRTVHRSPDVFSSEIGGTSLEDLEPEHIEARKSMIDMDRPRHDELRGLVNRRFTPKAVGVWEQQVRTVVSRVLDEALPMGEFEFVREIASEIPMQVFAEILGVPQDERREIIEIGDRLLGNADPEYAVEPDDAHRHLPFSSPAALDMFAFGRRIADERRQHPQNDIMSDLVNAELTQRDMDVYSAGRRPSTTSAVPLASTPSSAAGRFAPATRSPRGSCPATVTSRCSLSPTASRWRAPPTLT